MAGRLASPLLPALPSSLRHARLHSVACKAQMAQQTSSQPAQGLASWGTGELKSADISRTGSRSELLSTTTTPLDVLLDDVKFLEAKTGLDLMTPLQEVKGVHDQVCCTCCALYRTLAACADSTATVGCRWQQTAYKGGANAYPLGLLQVSCSVKLSCKSDDAGGGCIEPYRG